MLLRRALVLGSGPLAEAMAEDLEATRDLFVRVVDAGEARGDDLRGLVSEFHVVVSAIAAEEAVVALRGLIEAKRLVADANARVEEALAIHELALAKHVAACVGCGSPGLARLLGCPSATTDADVRVAALITTALARRLLSEDFHPHWGIWTPERLAARVGMAHGIRQDLRERGVELR